MPSVGVIFVLFIKALDEKLSPLLVILVGVLHRLALLFGRRLFFLFSLQLFLISSNDSAGAVVPLDSPLDPLFERNR